MINKDRYGRPIYPKAFRKLKATGDHLGRLGYHESKKNPNLFYRNHRNRLFQIVFFADFRGGKFTPIWEEPYPLFFWEFEPSGDEYDLLLRQRVVYTEWRRIDRKVKIRHTPKFGNEAALIEAAKS